MSQSDNVKLISADGFEFIISREAAYVSNTIKSMLDEQGGFMESETNQITFPGISGAVLERLCQYCYYKVKYLHTPSTAIPEFKVHRDMALDLLMAANYLDM
ncbi:hypothetical protein ACKKBG_A27710 [Auxenochlorella protothecoides x Auxenochlorella symbiontica]|uniref:Elongin-C n=1 Tax=Auxenochlorella protothecoides TaxID=3075 RepID=A0A1D2A7L1_AUXPR|nr:hypothetical protein APUTEX25_000735 [Auxenochlorella protothecoides]|eukprot:RMZ52616.1 hypothetical protein APUTEX25_000735 [Auxenochlorella protothecoides]